MRGGREKSSHEINYIINTEIIIDYGVFMSPVTYYFIYFKL